jgi:hypothetical protein
MMTRVGSAVYSSSADARCLNIVERHRSAFERCGVALVSEGGDSSVLFGSQVIEIEERNAKKSFDWIYSLLARLADRREVLVVDYTCMPVSLVSTILFAQERLGAGEVVFLYSAASRYLPRSSPRSPVRVEPHPFLPGRFQLDSQAALLLSIGFDGALSSSIEESLQPRELFLTVSEPTSGDLSPVEKANESLFARATGVVSVSVDAVLRVAEVARELVDIAGDGTGLVVGSVGPKSHALGLSIAAVLDPNISLLDVYSGGAAFSAAPEGPWSVVSVVTKFLPRTASGR